MKKKQKVYKALMVQDTTHQQVIVGAVGEYMTVDEYIRKLIKEYIKNKI